MSDAAARQAPNTETSFRGAFGPLAALALILATGFTAMGSFGVIQDAAKAELHLSDQALALIQGVSAALPLVVFSIPIGLLVDRVNRVRLCVMLSLLWIAGTLATAFASTATLLFLARMLVGTGATGTLTAALSLCADYCLPEARGRALLLVNLGKALGMGLAFALTAWLFGLFLGQVLPDSLGLHAAWRSAHVALAVIGVVSILPLLLLREPARQEVEATAGAPFRVAAAELWARRRFVAPLFGGQIAVVMADAAAGIWVAPVLVRNHHLQPQDFGGWLGLLIFSAGTLGTVVGGITVDLGQKGSRRGGLLLGAVIAAALGVPAALFPVVPSLGGLAAAMFVLCLVGGITSLAVSAALTVFLPNELRGLTIGAFIAIAGLIGFGIAPTLVTWTSGVLGGESHLAPALAIVGVMTSALALASFWLAMRRCPPSAGEYSRAA